MVDPPFSYPDSIIVGITYPGTAVVDTMMLGRWKQLCSIVRRLGKEATEDRYKRALKDICTYLTGRGSL